MRRTGFAVAFIAVCGILGILAWRLLYPEAGDPKSIDYVLWRHGLNPKMDLQAVFRGMTSDPAAFELVRGLSKEQLARKFGVLRGNGRACGTQGETYFLGNSIWFVTLENGRPIGLTMCKG